MSLPYPRSVPTATPPHREATFAELLAEQATHAPWLGLSICAHAAVLAILWMLPPATAAHEARTLSVLPPHTETVTEQEAEKPPPPQEPSKPELTNDDTLVRDAEAGLEAGEQDATTDTLGEAGSGDAVGKLAAFDGTFANSTLGLGGGAGSKKAGYGRRGGGGGGSGNATVAPAIEAALRWLAAHQDEDGKWDADEFMKHDKNGAACTGPGNAVHDVGVTGLALLAFLGDGNTLRSGPYRDHLKRGVAWLVGQQQDNGLFGAPTSHDFVYDHAIAAYALCEAYGLSQYRSLRPHAQRAIGYLESHRNPYGVWRYQPRDGDQDLSVTGWCVMALKAAADFGLEVDKNTFALCRTWIDGVTDPVTGGAGYGKRGEPSSRHPGAHGTRFPCDRNDAMTGVALTCRYFLGEDPKKVPTMQLAAQRLAQKLPRWDVALGSIDFYAWYYGSYALFQHGGGLWTTWSKAIDQALIAHQRKDGAAKGSWDPEADVWGEDGGRVYTTALGALTLQAYYRYSRVIR